MNEILTRSEACGDSRWSAHKSPSPMWDIQALGDWKENRILLTRDNSSEQLVLASFRGYSISLIDEEWTDSIL